MIEQPLHDRLAIVEMPSIASACTLAAPDVVIIRRCTSEMRPFGNSTIEIDIVEPGERIDRGAAGIARGRDHDGGALAALGQHVVHQPRDQLHRHVLERQRRAVKQLQHELVGAHLVERHHGGMAEGGIGLIRHAAEIGVGDLAADEGTDHLDRDFPIGAAEKGGDGLGRKLRPDLGHVEAAVAGKPGQHHVAEA